MYILAVRRRPTIAHPTKHRLIRSSKETETPKPSLTVLCFINGECSKLLFPHVIIHSNVLQTIGQHLILRSYSQIRLIFIDLQALNPNIITDTYAYRQEFLFQLPSYTQLSSSSSSEAPSSPTSNPSISSPRTSSSRSANTHLRISSIQLGPPLLSPTIATPSSGLVRSSSGSQ